MSNTMRAFVMEAVGKVAVVEKPIPEPGPDEAVVKTTHALVCTSDVHTVRGALAIPLGRTLGERATELPSESRPSQSSRAGRGGLCTVTVANPVISFPAISLTPSRYVYASPNPRSDVHSKLIRSPSGVGRSVVTPSHGSSFLPPPPAAFRSSR